LKFDLQLLKSLNALYIEDDLNEQKHNFNSFVKFFNSVKVCDSIREAEEIYMQNSLDVIFVDINLIDGNGLDWIKSIRKLDEKTSFIVITSSSELNDLLFAIPLKLEDYIIKPLTFEKLKTTFNKILQSRFKSRDKKFRFPNGVVYCYLGQLFYKNDIEFQLTKHEADLLELLIENLDMMVSYEMIELELYQNRPLNRGTIRNHIKKIRDIIGAKYLISFIDKGYKLTISPQ